MMRMTMTLKLGSRGSALIVSLVLLVAMTLLALASVRGTSLQERMGANMYDRELAFQAAEAGIRAAENRLAIIKAGGGVPDFNGVNGMYPRPVPAEGTADRWNDTATNWAAAPAVATGPRTVIPQYIVEDMGEWPDPPDCIKQVELPPGCMAPRYRITSRNQAPGGVGAQVMLQTTYRP